MESLTTRAASAIATSCELRAYASFGRVREFLDYFFDFEIGGFFTKGYYHYFRYVDCLNTNRLNDSGYISKDTHTNNLTDLVYEFCENQLNF